MAAWNRRSVLATGATLAVSSGIATTATGDDGAEEDTRTDDDLPDSGIDPNPGMVDEDWPSHRGGPGHARFLEDGHEFDGDTLEVAWTVEHGGLDSMGNVGTVAVADDTVYTTTEDGVVALEAADGSVVWENTEINAGTPSVVGESVYCSGEEVVALDRTDGSVRWETAFDSDGEIHWQTVAYGGVYVVVDGTLYALEADDGSVRWEKESITAPEDLFHGEGEAEYEFVTATAAANGVVYCVTGAGPVAFDPETGAERWQYEREPYTTSSGIHATSTAVAYYGGAYNERSVHDAQSGEWMTMAHGTRELAIGEEMYVGGGTDHEYAAGSIDGDDPSWELDVTYTYGRAVISGDTVYAYLYQSGHNSGARDYDEELVALHRDDGTEKWALGRADAPVGEIRAISGDTIYVSHDDDLVALRDEPDDDESDDDEPDCPDEDTGSECDAHDDGASDGDGFGDSGSDDDEDEAGTETTADEAAESMPGLTTGAGIVGGALGLEWLRRNAGTDDTVE